MKKKSGCIVDGKWMTHYDIGRDAYDSREQYSEAQSRTWQQGWRAGRDSDMKLLNQATTTKRRDSITQRLCEAMGIQNNLIAA